MACQAGQYLRQQGASRVAFCLPNSIEEVLCYLGAWLSGTEAVPVNVRLSEYELLGVAEQFQPDLLIVPASRQTVSFTAGLPAVTRVVNARQLRGELGEMPPQAPSGYDEQVLTYHLTSGTMGCHKAVGHTLARIQRYARKRGRDFGYRADDCLLIVTSLNHAFSFSYQFLPALALGLEMILVPGFQTEQVYENLLSYSVTSLALLPAMSYQLAQYALAQQHIPVSALRYAIVAGDSVPEAFQQTFYQAFGTHLYQGVGMTEIFGYAQNVGDARHLRSVGRVLDGVRLYIAGENHQSLPVGETGEIYLQTETDFQGYYQAPGLTAGAFYKNWLCSGDLGYVDNEGYLYLLGRKKQIIISGGSNIAPVEVEQALYVHPGVIEACAVGRQDALMGQVVWAYVVMADPADCGHEALVAHTRQYLAAYKCPGRVIVLEHLPKTATGKIDRNALKARADQTDANETPGRGV